MVNFDNLVINEHNAPLLQKYADQLADLNRTIKDSILKKVMDFFHIGAVVSELHVEVEELNKRLHEYNKRNANAIINVGGYYVADGKFDIDSVTSWTDKSKTYIHVKNRSSHALVCDVVQFDISGSDRKSVHVSNYRSINVPIDKFVNRMYEGIFKETEQVQWDAAYSDWSLVHDVANNQVRVGHDGN